MEYPLRILIVNTCNTINRINSTNDSSGPEWALEAGALKVQTVAALPQV